MASPTKPQDKDDKTWIVALVVFGLMGIGGPVLALIMFFILANLI